MMVLLYRAKRPLLIKTTTTTTRFFVNHHGRPSSTFLLATTSCPNRVMLWLFLSLIVLLKGETHRTGGEASLAFVSRNADHTIVVSCVGDSITKGSGASNVNITAYPAVLQRLLAKRFRVHNFGVGGTTILQKSSFPYWSTVAYQESLTIKPDIVIAMWGTNDVSCSISALIHLIDCQRKYSLFTLTIFITSSSFRPYDDM